jgi:hypothetical protein
LRIHASYRIGVLDVRVFLDEVGEFRGIPHSGRRTLKTRMLPICPLDLERRSDPRSQPSEVPATSVTVLGAASDAAGRLHLTAAFADFCVLDPASIGSAHRTLRSTRNRLTIATASASSTGAGRASSRAPVRVVPVNAREVPDNATRFASASTGSDPGSAA